MNTIKSECVFLEVLLFYTSNPNVNYAEALDFHSKLFQKTGDKRLIMSLGINYPVPNINKTKERPENESNTKE